jgi:hypothetical protein
MPGWDYLDDAPDIPPGADVGVLLCTRCMRAEVVISMRGRFIRRVYLDDTPVLHR